MTYRKDGKREEKKNEKKKQNEVKESLNRCGKKSDRNKKRKTKSVSELNECLNINFCLIVFLCV